jgi:hypothetical protein
MLYSLRRLSRRRIYYVMSNNFRASPFLLPAMMAQLAMASWETIMRRSMMMVQGTCSPDEYHRMTSEKVAAVQTSMMALARGRGHAEMLAPFASRSQANVKRLRREA